MGRRGPQPTPTEILCRRGSPRGFKRAKEERKRRREAEKAGELVLMEWEVEWKADKGQLVAILAPEPPICPDVDLAAEWLRDLADEVLASKWAPDDGND